MAIAVYEDKSGNIVKETYLFYRDQNWEVLNDTFHDSIVADRDQTPYEYAGTKTPWIEIKMTSSKFTGREQQLSRL